MGYVTFYLLELFIIGQFIFLFLQFKFYPITVVMAWYAVALLLLVTSIPGFDAQDDMAMRVCQAYYSVIDGKLVVIRGNG